MKKIIILLSIIILPLLTSCYDFFELKGVSFCFGISFDYDQKEDKKYCVNIETEVIKNHLSQTDYESTIHETRGNTFSEAYSNLTSSTSSRIDFTHCQLIIINSNIDYLDLKNLIASLFDNILLSNGIYILMAYDGDAKDILKSESITDASLSFEIIYALKEDGHYYDKTFKKSISDMYNDFYSETGGFLLPTVILEKQDDKDVAILTGALLYNNHQFIRHLDNDELRYSLFVGKKIEKFLFNVNINEQTISLCVNPFKLNKKIIDGEKINFIFNYKLPITVTESFDISKNNLKTIETILEDKIKNCFLENQKNSIDIFNLTTYLYKYNYSIYKKHINNININNFIFSISIEINIINEGVIR